MNADLETVYQGLVGAFHGAPLRSGDVLTAAGHTADDSALAASQCPYLGFSMGALDASEWGGDDWTDEIRWVIPARLTVIADADDGGAALRSAVTDLMQRCRAVRGLPYDDKGLAVDDQTSRYIDRLKSEEIRPLVDRRGPHIAGISLGGPFDSGKYVAQMTFRLAFKMTLDPRQLRRAQVVVLGMKSYDVAKSTIDTTLPGEVMLPRFTTEDRRAVGRLTFPPTRIVDNGVPRYLTGEDGVDGPFPKDLPRELIVNPRSVSVAALATTQLSAIVYMQDDVSKTATDAASWQSSDATKATVSSSGLVTGVAAGSAVITATHLGVSATCAVTVT